MMTAALSIVVVAALFVVYGLVAPPRTGCGANCGACARPCHPPESDDAT